MSKYLNRFLCCLLLSCGLKGYIQASTLSSEVVVQPATQATAQATPPALPALPEAIWQLVFSCLWPKELIHNLFLVNSAWHDQAQDAAVWRHWELQIRLKGELQQPLVTIKLYKGAAKERFRYCITADRLKWASQAPYLRHKTLIFYASNYPSFQEEFKTVLAAMSALVLIKPKPSDGLKILEGPRTTVLRYLGLKEGSIVEQSDFHKLRACTDLHILRFEKMTHLDKLGFLSALSQLTRLELRLEAQVSSWEPLGQCGQLTHLALELGQDWPRAWAVVKSLKNLEFISLTSLGCAPPFDGIKLTWHRFTRLRELALYHYPYEDMSSLLPLKDQLQALYCDYWEHLKSVKDLAGFTKLAKLTIDASGNVETLEPIHRLPLLVLALRFVGDACVQELRAPHVFPQLKEVYYAGGNSSPWYPEEEAARAALRAARPNLLVGNYAQYKASQHTPNQHFRRSALTREAA